MILILLLKGFGPALLIIVFDALEHAKYLFELSLVGRQLLNELPDVITDLLTVFGCRLDLAIAHASER